MGINTHTYPPRICTGRVAVATHIHTAAVHTTTWIPGFSIITGDACPGKDAGNNTLTRSLSTRLLTCSELSVGWGDARRRPPRCCWCRVWGLLLAGLSITQRGQCWQHRMHAQGLCAALRPGG